MRKNCERAYKAWRASKSISARQASIWSDGDTLWSYETALLAIDVGRGTVVFNTTRYSVTTSRHQIPLLAELRIEYGVMLREVDGVPKGASPEAMIALSRRSA